MKKLSRTSSLVVAIAVTAILLSASIASAVIIPAGLNPGDTYHLVFVTDGTRDATSSDIEDYNDFVQGEAALNPVMTGTDLGVQYHAIASTQAVNALSNAPISGAVYLLDGTTLIATSSADMWDGMPPPARINTNQYGDPAYSGGAVWTGTDYDGTGGLDILATVFSLGSYTGVGLIGDWSQPYHPALNNETAWINVANDEDFTVSLPFYAMSEALIVPPAVPEPTTFSLGIFAAGGLFGFLWRRRRITR